MESLATLLSRNTVSILWRPLQKVRSIESWELESFSVEVFHYFQPICHYQRIRGLVLAQKDVFQPLPPPLPHHLTEVTQQGQTPSSFRTDYLGKGVEEIQFARKGRMVSGGVPQGF